MASDAESTSLFSGAEEQLAAGGRWCHLGSSSLETVPGVPSACGAPLSLKIGSPPGLSRASQRQARDACKLQVPPALNSNASASLLTIGPSGKALSPPQAVKLARRRAARETMLARAKEEALLQSRENQRTKASAQERFEGEETVPSTWAQKMSVPSPIEDVSDNEESTDVGFDGASEDDSASDWSCPESLRRAPQRRCRFNGSALETIPATPVSGAPGVGSPPGLSRASMRQARDACKAALPTPAWGGYSSAAALPLPGKQMTPTSLRLARLRAARDSLSVPVAPESKWASAAAPLVPR